MTSSALVGSQGGVYLNVSQQGSTALLGTYVNAKTQHSQTVNVVSSSSSASVKGIAKTVSDACSSSIVALKSVGKNVSDVCASSIVALKSVGKNVSDACASSIVAVKSASKNVLTECASSISTIKGIWKLVTAYCSSSVTNTQPNGGQANVTFAPQGTVQSDIIVQGTSAVDFSATGTAKATLT